MNPIRIAQQGLEEAMQKSIEAAGAMVRFTQIIAKAKEAYVKEKLMGEEFLCDDLLEPGKDTYEWKYEDFKDHVFKVVAVKTEVDSWEARKSYDGGACKLFTLNIAFLRDPDEILNSKMKLTTCEIKLLKELNNYYGRNWGYRDYDDLVEIQRNLRELKHNFNLLITSYWSFPFDTITQDGFVEYGLRAQSKIL